MKNPVAEISHVEKWSYFSTNSNTGHKRNRMTDCFYLTRVEGWREVTQEEKMVFG